MEASVVEREDPLDALREAWRALDAPDPTADRDAVADPAERAALEWMRAAWGTLEAPPVRVPVLRRRRVRRSLALVPLAAAAGIAAALWLARSDEHASQPAESEPAPVAETLQPEVPATALAALERAEGGFELRHGSVRLIFVEPEPSAAESGDAR